MYEILSEGFIQSYGSLWISSKLESQVYSLGTSNSIRIIVYQRLWYVIGFISTQITLNGCQGRPVASFTDKISLSNTA